GIPVVAIDAILPDGPQKAQIGVDNAAAGADMGKYFLDYVKANMGGKAKLGVVGALNSFIQNIRQDGFEKTLKGVDGVRYRAERGAAVLQRMASLLSTPQLAGLAGVCTLD
ncbi:substrate-binding domain-containing protein, partial [Rhizobium ruizarguesonis]